MFGKIFLREDKPTSEEAIINILFEDNFKKNFLPEFFDKKIQKKIEKRIKKNNFLAKEEEILELEGDNFENIVLVGGGKKNNFNLIKWQNLLAKAWERLKSKKIKNCLIFYQEELGKDYFEIGKKLAISFYLSNYHFDQYLGEEKKKEVKELELVNFYIKDKNAREKIQKGLDWGQLVSSGVYFARDLVNQPASHLHPETLVEEAFKIEKESKGKITVEVLDRDECQRLGMGAFLGVAQGSDREPKFIVLKYPNPKVNANKQKICFIGKSITFDSGGLSLKPSEMMEWMKVDMSGGATVLGIFKILAQSDEKESFSFSEIYGILPACENMPSGKAMRPGDIVKAMNGKTIEVLNTDAEGRLTLADALVYAEKSLKVNTIIDLATLTGACMVALGTKIAGLFGNDKKLVEEIKEISQKEGELVWELPLHKPYKKLLRSDIADIKNISGGRYGGTITAALFLSDFVEKATWVHLDIAGPAFNDEADDGIVKKGGTGFGVLTLLKFLKKGSSY